MSDISKEDWYFELWKHRNKDFCDALEGEELGLDLIYFCLQEVKRISKIRKRFSSDEVDDFIQALTSLEKVHKILSAIIRKLIHDGEEDKAMAITSFVIVKIDNGNYKRARSVLAGHVEKIRRDQKANYVVPSEIASPIWLELQNTLGRKLSLWKLAFLAHPYDTIRSNRKRKMIMVDLYDAIQEGVLPADKRPYKFTADQQDYLDVAEWEVNIDEFSAMIDKFVVKPYFYVVLNLWKSYENNRTHRHDKLENPEPFYAQSLEISGEALDDDTYDRALFLKIKEQKNATGERNFKDAHKYAVDQVKGKEGYEIVDTFDELQNQSQTPYELRETNELNDQDEKTFENSYDYKTSYFKLSGSSKYYYILKDADERFRQLEKKQHNQESLWMRLPDLCKDYGIRYENGACVDGKGFLMTKKSFVSAYKSAFEGLIKK